MTIFEKLQTVQQELNAPKNQYNSFGKYNYRSCEDILEGVKPILDKVKAVLTISDTLVQIGDRYYVKSTATFIDTETEARVENIAYAREEENKKGMDASQVTGAASSYARKYALNGLFCIDDVKDADTRDNSKEHLKSEKIDKNKIAVIEKELSRTGVNQKVILDICEIKKLEDMNIEQFTFVMQKFKKTPDKK